MNTHECSPKPTVTPTQAPSTTDVKGHAFGQDCHRCELVARCCDCVGKEARLYIRVDVYTVRKSDQSAVPQIAVNGVLIAEDDISASVPIQHEGCWLQSFFAERRVRNDRRHRVTANAALELSAVGVVTCGTPPTE